MRWIPKTKTKPPGQPVWPWPRVHVARAKCLWCVCLFSMSRFVACCRVARLFVFDFRNAARIDWFITGRNYYNGRFRWTQRGHECRRIQVKLSQENEPRPRWIGFLHGTHAKTRKITLDESFSNIATPWQQAIHVHPARWWGTTDQGTWMQLRIVEQRSERERDATLDASDPMDDWGAQFCGWSVWHVHLSNMRIFCRRVNLAPRSSLRRNQCTTAIWCCLPTLFVDCCVPVLNALCAKRLSCRPSQSVMVVKERKVCEISARNT